MDTDTDILIYQTEDGNTKIDVKLENGTVWMTQKAIAELYQKGVSTINEHIKNIYEEDELQEEATIRKNRIVQTEGQRQVEREVAFYNLELIRFKMRKGKTQAKCPFYIDTAPLGCPLHMIS
ncbi:hypothetical protein A7K91_03130 [Paenibacillus oryzae]|uniref:Cell filamentation protein Fic n=1 Tax=Paenibacillus oryzae TaxID=1844972 RepID=A0A1A5YLF3_9BACL|nr:hypothetical protein [Paenibacillus oryzae]OBR66457.1 hypothetical protein A7K91_03130 [Paenibacillus oryzae]